MWRLITAPESAFAMGEGAKTKAARVVTHCVLVLSSYEIFDAQKPTALHSEHSWPAQKESATPSEGWGRILGELRAVGRSIYDFMNHIDRHVRDFVWHAAGRNQVHQFMDRVHTHDEEHFEAILQPYFSEKAGHCASLTDENEF
jgi:hypothetical protein